MTFRPMLAARLEDLSLLRYPVLASPKLDGVRAIVRDGRVLSRSLKPIPNASVQAKYCRLEGYDGELVVGSVTAEDVYLKTVSGVMTEYAPLGNELFFIVFDNAGYPHLPFEKRHVTVDPAYRLPHLLISGEAELLAHEKKVLEQGFEGLVTRDPLAAYKYGRSTPREQGMMKLKRFKDDEALVVEFEELYSNQNEATQNELGYTDRSSHKANLVPRGTLGALVVRWRGLIFRIGTGFTADERQAIWAARESYVDRLVKFKYLEVGMKDLPRHPVFLGWRDSHDMEVEQ